jgi:hypothetical protein
MFLQGGCSEKIGSWDSSSEILVCPAVAFLRFAAMNDQITFSAQCPTCKNEVDQGPLEPDEIRRLLRQDSLSFYCGLCDHAWTPSSQELANVECLLLNPLLQAL